MIICGGGGGGDWPFWVWMKFVITGVRWSGFDNVGMLLYLCWFVVVDDDGRNEKKLFCDDIFFVWDIGRFPFPSIKLAFVLLPLPIGFVNDGTGRRDL